MFHFENKTISLSYVQVFLVVLAVMASGVALYFYLQYRSLNEQNTTMAVKEKLIEDVGKIFLLPENEEPTMATVTNPDVLREQEFFTRAEKGDKVLIYPSAKRAILYRSSIRKIVEVMPFELPPQVER